MEAVELSRIAGQLANIVYILVNWNNAYARRIELEDLPYQNPNAQ